MITARQLATALDQPPPTDEQAAVIESDLAPAAVIAGAGSGKTETMAARVVWLIANDRVSPDQVLGLTFTRKAAAELGARIRRRLAQWRRVLEREQPDAAEQLAALRAVEPTVLTYAAYAGRLVSEQAPRIGAEPDARLLSPALVWQVADQVVRRWPGPLEVKTISSPVQWLIEIAGHLADHLSGPADVEAFCAAALEQYWNLPQGEKTRSPTPNDTGPYVKALQQRAALMPLVMEFQQVKRRHGAVDFGDQTAAAARIAASPEVAAIERDRYRVVLLDEYQDTGHAQIEMLKGLFGGGHPMTAVGDPFQSIYGWRGASAGNMGSFDVTFPHADRTPATVYPLATSFRNDRRILAAANAVAAPLRTNRVTMPLRAHDNARPGRVLVTVTETVQDEAQWVARQVSAAWAAMQHAERTAAVLVRRRSQMPMIADALSAAGLPVEVVGLGGLLTTPEVVDVVATLRVLGDVKPGGSLMRILTGARWRIGARDLAVLRDRGAYLVRPSSVSAAIEHSGGGSPAVRPAPDAEREPISLVEALDDLGPPDRYSPAGYRRMTRLAGELRRLRRRLTAPLAELVAEVEQAIGVHIEVQARPDRAHIGRVHLDRFLDEAAEFAAEAGDASLRAFLAYLDAAEQEENGLEAGEVDVAPERVQLLTVHGAKGLEWDVVAVPGLVEEVFPATPKSINWTRAREELPGPLRGDSDSVPTLDLSAVTSRKEVGDKLKEHDQKLKDRHQDEELRLAYVALTRARSMLFASGYAWDTTKEPRRPSPFLVTVREHAECEEWFLPEPDAQNPVTAEAPSAQWPVDPLGTSPRARGTGRRAAVEAGAALVRAAQGQLPGLQVPGPLPAGVSARAAEWRHNVDTLLAERERLQRSDVVEVDVPAQLSVSQLVELKHDAEAFARSLRRPVPRPPAPLARRGTAFHLWLEQRWQRQALLDLDELPGAADEGADDTDFEQLRAAFERSEWAERTPVEVEVPFEMTIGARVVRGRMDAVFSGGDGGWLVIDWKTGRKPAGAAADAAAVQLAAYRLAWARLCGLPDAQLHRVRAAFHYVRTNETVEPAAFVDATGLRRLIEGADGAAERANDQPAQKTV